MKLYNKKIRSVSALESEKKLLQQQKQMLEKDELFTVEGVVSSVGNDIKGSAGKLMEGMLPNSSSYIGSLFSLVAGIVRNRFKGRNSEKKERQQTPHTEEKQTDKKKGGGILNTVAKELIGGYLKWKAVELSYKGVTLSVRKHKKKKQKQAAEAAAAASHKA